VPNNIYKYNTNNNSVLFTNNGVILIVDRGSILGVKITSLLLISNINYLKDAKLLSPFDKRPKIIENNGSDILSMKIFPVFL